MSQLPSDDRKTVRQLRLEKRLSRMQLAILMGCTVDTVRNIETGRVAPNGVNVEKLYLIFGVPVGSIEWLLRPSKSVA